MIEATVMIGSGLIVVGCATWLTGYFRQQKALEGKVSFVQQQESFQRHIHGLMQAYPELLPALPESSFEYTNWFSEVLKRSELRSRNKTHAEGLVLLKQVRECYEEWFKITQTQKALYQVAGHDKRLAAIEERQHEANLLKLDLEIARTKAAIKDLNNPPASPPTATRRDPVEDAISKIRQTLRTVAGVEAECDQLITDNPEWAEYIKEERRRILMDLRNRR